MISKWWHSGAISENRGRNSRNCKVWVLISSWEFSKIFQMDFWCLHPKHDQGSRMHADADASGNRLKEYANFDPTTVKLRSGWINTFVDCPILWASNLQSQIALSSAKAEYISLFPALRCHIANGAHYSIK